MNFNQDFRDRKIKITAKSDYKVDKSLINTRDDFNYTINSYQIMIKEMKNWILDHKNLYKHYTN